MAFVAAESEDLGRLLGLSSRIEHEESTAEAIDLAAFALSTPHPLPHWLHPDGLDQLVALAAEARDQQRRLQAAQRRLFASYRPAVLDQDLSQWKADAEELAEVESPGSAVKDIDALLQQEPYWREQFVATSETLAGLMTTGTEVAKLCGLEDPSSLEEYGALAHLATLLADTPCPPQEWFDAELRRQARKDILALQRKYRRLQEIRAQLRATYTDQIFLLDPVLQKRFRGDYKTVLRFARPSWYQDRAHIRACLMPGRELPGYATLTHDVDLAQEAKALDQQLADEWESHREGLGPLFAGESTDWEALSAQVTWVDRFCSIALEWGWTITPEIHSLAAQPRRHWAEFTARQQRLAAHWQQWKDLERAWQSALDVPRFVQSATLADASPAVVGERIDRLQAALEGIWVIRRILSAHHLATQPILWPDIQQVIQDGIVIAHIEAWLAEKQSALQTAFATWYTDQTTDWDRIQAALLWCREAIQRHQGSPPSETFVSLVASTEQDDALLRSVAELQQQLEEHRKKLAPLWRQSDDWLPRSVFQPAGIAMNRASYAVLQQRVQEQLDALPQLERWISFLQSRERCDELGLTPFIEALIQALDARRVPWTDHPAQKTAWKLFEKRFYEAWLTVWIHNISILESFRGQAHDQVIQRFRSADVEHIRQSRKRLANELFLRRRRIHVQLAQAEQSYSRDAFSEALLELRRQINLKRRKSLRRLVELAGPAMCELMPCWMMSPLTVSEYIDPHAICFDLVIFDEASQVCAEDAISSIMRGRQLIVVGDEKQLPPTNVFRKSLSLDDANDDEAEEEQEARPQESILKECAGAAIPTRMLRVHYRSRHEALIAFSNAHFYDGALVTFPSAQAEHSDGLQFLLVEKSVYDRGGSRTNRMEAERVAEIVMSFAEHQPSCKVGVVAFSATQQHAIEDEIDRRLKERPELQQWFNEEKEDAFFVRNLESVQGDERDVIILSVGYGRDRFGKMTQNFGPLNSSGGERRLNVAITRARKKMIVVSSIRADDIKGDTEGTRALRGYLDFAEHGKDALILAPTLNQSDQFDSPFEEEVCRALRARGLLVDTQIGCSGYRIDMAIRDPERADRYILGIECDGASYHSAKTARDRDRLRQAQLESLGWKIHRIWSRDWFISPQREIIKILERLEGQKMSSAH